MDSFNNRLTNLQSLMQKEKIDLVVLGPGSHTQWLLGFVPHADERACLTCISQTGAALLMPQLNAGGCRTSTNLPFFEWSDEDGPDSAFDKLLQELGVKDAKSVVLDESMRTDFAFLVVNAIPGANVCFTEKTIGYLRLKKDASEYSSLKENALIADKAMRSGWSTMQEGMSELEVAKIIREEFSKLGAKPLFTIIGAGESSAIPHHATGDRKLKQGDVVVMDIGGGKDGYSSDITRMAVVAAAPPDYQKIHDIVASAAEAAIKVLRPGVRAKDIDAAARNVIEEAGYGQYFTHRTGHGLGLEIHEPPYLTSTSDTILETGMVFSIEPGIYIPNRFGVRLENIIYLRADGPEILSELPLDVKIIP